MSGDENSSSFTIGNGAQLKGLPYVPQCYLVSPSNRSSLDTEKAQVPTIDMTGLRQNDSERSVTIKELGNACRRGGFFQVSEIFGHSLFSTSFLYVNTSSSYFH